LIDWGAPLTLLGETAEAVSEAQRELCRIGIDRPAAAATGSPEDWIAGAGRQLASFPTATFADLAEVRHHRRVVVLDVRRSEEHDGRRIDGAINIPIHELPSAARGAAGRSVGALRQRLSCLCGRIVPGSGRTPTGIG
jgi:hypothetical protein